MADLGLLGGLAEGLKSGIDAYRTERAYGDQKRKDALEQAFKKAQLQEMGYDVGQDGSPVLSDFGSLKKSLATAQAKRSLESYDPNSETSQRQVQSARGLLSAADPEHPGRFDGIVAPGTSAADLQEQAKEGLLGKTLSGVYSTQGRQITAARIGEGNQIKRDSLELRKDAQASHAADTVHKDPRIVQITRQMEQLERGRGILDQPTITNQEFNDYQQEIQAAISGASGGALGKLERTEYVSAQQALAALKQKITGKPQDAVPREIVERLKALADHTRDIMDKHRAARAEALQRNFKSNPAANTEMQKAIGTYKLSAEQSPGLIKQGNSVSPEDQAAINWAIQNKSDPRAANILQLHGIK